MRPNFHARLMWKRIYPFVRDILRKQWDPIGAAAPEDEYDYYAMSVTRLLMRGADRDRIAVYLRQAAAESLDCPISDEHAARVADMLVRLDVLERAH